MRQPDGIIRRGAFQGHEGEHVEHTHPGVLAGLGGEVEFGGARLREGDRASSTGPSAPANVRTLLLWSGSEWRPRMRTCETARTASVMREIFAASFPSLKFGTASKAERARTFSVLRARDPGAAALMSARCVKACGNLEGLA